MSLTVSWAKEAKATYEDVIVYLKANWSDKEVIKFINRTESVLNIISIQPYAFKASNYKRIRKAVIGTQNSLIYLVRDTDIYLIAFWDNRMDPKKNKY
jgi:plasmid stabilization system protein ParE